MMIMVIIGYWTVVCYVTPVELSEDIFTLDQQQQQAKQLN